MRYKNVSSPILSQEVLKKCQETIGYQFKNISLLQRALTHASIQSENNLSNERLEFLGDAVLGMVICDFLYLTFPDFDEGDLTLIKSEVVSRNTLSRIGKKIQLYNFFAFNGANMKWEDLPDSVMANVFEAIIGAIYLDRGIEPSKKFILAQLSEEIESVIKDPYQKNYKSLLQFLVQKHIGATPNYQMIKSQESNPSSFTSCVSIGNRKFLAATGKNKKESEQMAAHATLEILSLEDPVIAEHLSLLTQKEEDLSNSKSQDISHLFHNSQSLLLYTVKKLQLPSPQYHKTKIHSYSNKRVFFVNVSLGGRTFPEACASKYKEAERLAARSTLEILAQEYSSKGSLDRLNSFSFISEDKDPIPLWQSIQWMNEPQEFI